MDQSPLPTTGNLREDPEKKARSSASWGWGRVLLFLLLAGGIAAFFALGGNRAFTFEALKASRDALLAYTKLHFWAALGGGVLIYTASTSLSLPIATVLSLAAGYLFGRWVGTAMIVLSATLGATLVFLAARYIFAEAAQRRMGALAQKVIAGFHENDFNYLLFLRLVPLFPFWLVNLAPAFTPIRVRTFVTATAIGIAPASFIFANLGQSLGQIESPEQLLSPRTLLALILLGALSLLPILVKRFRARKSVKGSS